MATPWRNEKPAGFHRIHWQILTALCAVIMTPLEDLDLTRSHHMFCKQYLLLKKIYICSGYNNIQSTHIICRYLRLFEIIYKISDLKKSWRQNLIPKRNTRFLNPKLVNDPELEPEPLPVRHRFQIRFKKKKL